MELLKVIDNFAAEIVGNYGANDTSITLSDSPNGITVGYLTIFNEEGEQYEKIKFTAVAANVYTVVRGLSFDTNSDTPVTGNAKELKSGMRVKLSVSQHYLNAIVDVLNGVSSLGGVLKNPAARTISDPRHIPDKEYIDAIATAGVTILQVTDNGGVTINVNAGYYIVNGSVTYYAGASNQSLTDDAVNYIEIKDGVLAINTTAFSEDAMPLAKVTCASSAITILEDSRALLSWSDIKENYGIARDGFGVYIDLSATPGLEFSGGKLQAKVKTDGGIKRDGDGLSIDEDAPNVLPIGTVASEEVLGEALDAGKAYFKQPSDNSVSQTSPTSGDTSGGNIVVNNLNWWAIKILSMPASVAKITSLNITVSTLTAAGIMTVKLYQGSRSNIGAATLLGTKTINITSTGAKTITFDSAITINASLEYFITLAADTTLNTNTGIVPWSNSTGEGIKLYVSNNQGGTWKENIYQGSFVYGSVTLVGSNIYGASSAFDGITQEGGAKGDTIACIQEGVADVANCTERSRYKLSGSGGGVTAASDGVAVGISPKDGKLLIMRNI